MNEQQIKEFSIIAKTIAKQFGPNCEVVVHNIETNNVDNTIVALENGHVSGRKIGDGPSRVVLSVLNGTVHPSEYEKPYLTKTSDGRILKSTTCFIYDSDNNITGLLGINLDITVALSFNQTMKEMVGISEESKERKPTAITRNISDILDDLFTESEAFIGKHPNLMTKDDRVRAIKYLDDRGAFLISKSSQKACTFFNISKYSFYTYLDEARELN